MLEFLSNLFSEGLEYIEPLMGMDQLYQLIIRDLKEFHRAESKGLSTFARGIQ